MNPCFFNYLGQGHIQGAVWRKNSPKAELSQDSVAHLNCALPIKLKCFSEQKIKGDNHWTVKYRLLTMKNRSLWPTWFQGWLIITKYHVQISNSLQDIKQNHWTMKYRLQWQIFILRSNIRSYGLVIPKYGVHISNSLQDKRQNHWTKKYVTVTYIYFEVNCQVKLCLSTMFIHQIVFKICEITDHEI